MDHDGVLYLGKIRSERWFGATLCAPGGAGTGHDWALSARRKRQTIVGGWLRGTLTFRRTRTVTAGVSGGSGYSRGVSSRPHLRLPQLQCSRDFRDTPPPPPRKVLWEHVFTTEAGGDQIDLEFASSHLSLVPRLKPRKRSIHYSNVRIEGIIQPVGACRTTGPPKMWRNLL